MIVRENIPLASLTTFHIGGPARFYVEATTECDVQAACDLARREGLPLAVIGAGSNLLAPDEGVSAVVLKLVSENVHIDASGQAIADAGAAFDVLVDTAAQNGWYGIENLAGIPGTVGGAVAQNIGAYGTEIAHVFEYADVFDVHTGRMERIAHQEATFSYRHSHFKTNKQRIIVRAAFRLSKEGKVNSSYPDLLRAKAQGIPLTTPIEVVRAVRQIRAAKFPHEAETGTAGSFFKNPSVSEETARKLRGEFPELPIFAQKDGRFKLSLAWLLDHALALNGFTLGKARLFEKQPLVIATERGACARDVHALAGAVAQRIEERFAITLEREVESFEKILFESKKKNFFAHVLQQLIHS